MRFVEHHAVLSAAYTLADRTLTRALLTRVRKETTGLLSSSYGPLPTLLMDEVIASRDGELLGALASSAVQRGVLFHRLAALGEPAIAVELYGLAGYHGSEQRRAQWQGHTRDSAQRRAVWQGAVATAARSGWREENGLVARLLTATHPDLLLPALHSPFPDLVAHALTKTSHLTSAADQLRACRRVLDHSDVRTLLAVAEPPAVRHSVAQEVARACASATPDGALGEAIEAATRGRQPQQPAVAMTAAAQVTGATQQKDAALRAGAPDTGRAHAREAGQERRHAGGRPGAAGRTAAPRTATVPQPTRSRQPAAAPQPTTLPRTAAAGSPRKEATARTHELIEQLRGTRTEHIVLPRSPGGLPWKALIWAHRAKPFTIEGLRRLWQHPDCPEELAVAAFAASSWQDPAGALYWPMLTAVDFGHAEEGRLRKILPPGVASGAFPVDRVLNEIRPARKVLDALSHSDARVSAALTPLVARLGTAFAPWRALYTLLPRFSGSVPELIDAALDEAPRHQGRTWPKPLGPQFPHRRDSIGRTTWLYLFERTDPATRCALSEQMDARTIQYLLLWHRPDQGLRDHLVRTHGASVLAGLASDWRTPPEVIEDLITYDDPELNAALFLYTNLTDAQRRHILSGRRWARREDTAAADRLPLTDALLDGLRESARRTWLLPICDSGDPQLCRLLLGSPRVKAHTPARHLHMLVRLWERHGPQAVRALLEETTFPGRKRGKHPLPPHVLQTARDALDAADGLAVLHAAEEHSASPAGQADFLRVNGVGSQGEELAKALDHWATEVGPAPVPWAELLAAHHAQPLHDRLLVGLAELESCPAELTEAARAAKLRLTHSHYTPRRGSRPPTVPEMLKKLPLPVHDAKSSWLTSACQTGQITLADVLRDGFPAGACAAFLGGALGPVQESRATTDKAAGQAVTDEVRRTRRAVAALARKHLGDDPEGWALALHLIPDFEGTLPELLTAAGAVVS